MSTIEQSVLVKTTGYTVYLGIVPLLVSFMLSTVVMLIIKAAEN